MSQAERDESAAKEKEAALKLLREHFREEL